MIDRKASTSPENEPNNIVEDDRIADKVDNNASEIYETTSTPSPTVIDLEIQDIEGIGPTTARKLKEAGIVSVMDLAVASAEELAVDSNSSKESAAGHL